MPKRFVVIETMPTQHRASHRAARNWGVYPLNGAVRRVIDRDLALEEIAADPDGYNHIAIQSPTWRQIDKYS